MRKFELNKLVRDGVLSDMLEHGQAVDHRILNMEEMPAALNAKLLEEAGEGDLVDLLEVIEHIARSNGKTFDQLRAEQLAKRAKIGGFSLGVFVGTVTLQDNDSWVEYYASEPERFPEVNE